MHIQNTRRAKLTQALAELEQAGYCTREAQALYFGGSVTAKRLEAMLAGAYIPTLVAAHIEHVMFKPKGWMSTDGKGNASPTAPKGVDGGLAVLTGEN